MSSKRSRGPAKPGGKSTAARGGAETAPVQEIPAGGAGAVALAGDESTGGATRGSSAFVDATAGTAPSSSGAVIDLPLVEAAREAAAAAGEAAAVRDDTGRIHTAQAISIPSLRTSALRAAALSAMLAGATRLQAAAVVSEAAAPADGDLAALLDLGGPGMPIVLVSAGGVRTRLPV